MLWPCSLLVLVQGALPEEPAITWSGALVRADEALARSDFETALDALDDVEVQRPRLATTLYYRARALAAERPALALEALRALGERGGYDPAIARWDPLLEGVRDGAPEGFEEAVASWPEKPPWQGAWQTAPYTQNGTVRAVDPFVEGGPPRHIVWSDGRSAVRIDLSTGQVVGRVVGRGSEEPARGAREGGVRLPDLRARPENEFVFDAAGRLALSLEAGGVVGVHELDGASIARRVGEFVAQEGPEWQRFWGMHGGDWREPFAAFAASPEPRIVVLDRSGRVTVRDLDGRIEYEPPLASALSSGLRTRLEFRFSPRVRTECGWGVGVHDLERGGLLWTVEDGEAGVRAVPGWAAEELYHGCGVPVVSPDLRHLAWADEDHVHMIDLRTGSEVWKDRALPDLFREHLSADGLAWSPDGAYLAVSTKEMFGAAVWTADGVQVVRAPTSFGNGVSGLDMRWESPRRVRVGGTIYELETSEVAPGAVAVAKDELGHYALRADVRVTPTQVAARTPISRDRTRLGLLVVDTEEGDALTLMPIPNDDGPGIALISPSGHIAPHGDPLGIRLLRPIVQRRPPLAELPELAARAIDPLAVRASRAGVDVSAVLVE